MSEVETVESTASEATPTEGAEPRQPSHVDLDAMGDHLVAIKVNGIEMEVPLSELRNGYMRQQDFTRKTQLLAERRKEVETAERILAAYQADPKSTVRMLAEQAGIESDDFAQFDDDDPVARKIAELEREIQTVRKREVEREIDREVGELKSRYNVDDSEVEDLMRFAASRSLDLQSAYKLLHFDDAHSALQQALARKKAEEQIIEEKKAAGAVHLGVGSSAATGGKTEVVERPRSIREAYLLAKQGKQYVG